MLIAILHLLFQFLIPRLMLWAAPTPTARQKPASGYYIADGYPSRITFGNKPNIAFFEIEVQGPGVDGGDKIAATSMLNDGIRTYDPPTLYDITPTEGTAKYDPDVWPDLISNINKLQVFTYEWPDGSTVCWWGWLRKAVPQKNREKELPKLDFTIEPSNHDLSYAEQVPVFTPAAGT